MLGASRDSDMHRDRCDARVQLCRFEIELEPGLLIARGIEDEKPVRQDGFELDDAEDRLEEQARVDSQLLNAPAKRRCYLEQVGGERFVAARGELKMLGREQHPLVPLHRFGDRARVGQHPRGALTASPPDHLHRASPIPSSHCPP